MNPNSFVQKCNDASNRRSLTWKPVLRQVLVCSGAWMSNFIYGLSTGAPTVFIPQIRKEHNSTAVIDDEMASWLSSAIGFSTLPWIIILVILNKLLGRKICSFIAYVNVFICFTIFYYSTSVVQVLIGEFTQGLFNASIIVIAPLILTEYTSPKYRGVFLTIKAATFYWGIWTSNAIGKFFHWKNIGLVGVICALYLTATVLIWPESPYWLANKGKYKECAVSHRWLKGVDEQSEKELKKLIESEKEYKKNFETTKISSKHEAKELYDTLISKKFFKPLLIALMTGVLVIFSGKLVFTIYAIDILIEITANESTAYTGMLILDGLTVLGMYMGCFLSRYLKRRPLLLIPSSIGVVVLFSISLYLYLINLSIIDKNIYVVLGLLILFSIAISCGPLLLAIAVSTELVPIRSRNLAMCMIALGVKLVLGILLKTFPYLIKALGLHGVFLFFGIISSIIIVFLYKFLPETKDKTLQEIADSINGIKNTAKVGEAGKLLEVNV